LEQAAWRPGRVRGALYASALAGGAGALTLAADRLVARWPPLRWVLGAGVVWAALGGRSLERAGEELAGALESADLDAARRLLPTLAGRDPSGLGVAEISRAGIESVAENTADAVTGPLFWAMLGGPAAAAVYRAANTLDAMVGHHSPRYERFGWAAARLDDVLGWAPARLAAGLAVLLAPLVGGDRWRTWRVLRRDGAAHPSPNAGRLEAAFAGALGLTLGGTNTYDGRIEHRPLLGDGRAPGPGDLRRAVRLARATGWSAMLVTAAGATLVRRAARAVAGERRGA
jgi:adenosylcobinamide-phosphate synthase